MESPGATSTDNHTEKDYSPFGSLFHQIISDMKNGTPLWEDLISKATKLHSCLRATIQAICSYLDAFQKIADAATNTRGATKDIGSALTRICLRHRAVEAKMKSFTSALIECLVNPLQEKLEDWKKTVVNLDKEHYKGCKKARSELKKKSTDTMKLQKKARKGSKTDDLQRAMHDVNEKRVILEETEKKSLRAALVEERSRYCYFVTLLRPVVEEEISMLSELSHLEEVMEQLGKHTADPYVLPLASEQILEDFKNSDSSWTLHSLASDSPVGSLGSRKSSLCSINSLNSSSSGSVQSHHSPSHIAWNRSVSQRVWPVGIAQQPSTHRLCSISSQDSGFTSQGDTRNIYLRNRSVSYYQQQVSSIHGLIDENDATLTMPTATWPNLQDALQFEKAANAIMSDRPHTISSGYEKGHQRPSLSVYTFQTPEKSYRASSPPNASENDGANISQSQTTYNCSPVVPTRNNSCYDRPTIPTKPLQHSSNVDFNNAKHAAVNIGNAATYANTYELARMAASKAQQIFSNSNASPNSISSTPTGANRDKHDCNNEKESSNSESSLESSSGYGSQSGMSIAPANIEQDLSTHLIDDCCSARVANAHMNEYQNVDNRCRLSSVSSSASSGYCTIKSGTLSRRGSVQGPKPPPPVRRTSSILSNASSSSTLNNTLPVANNNNNNVKEPPLAKSNSSSLENLPPPPAFMLEGTPPPSLVSEDHKPSLSVAEEIEKRNTLNAALVDQIKNNLFQKSNGALKNCEMSRKSFASPSTYQHEIEPSGISVASTVRTLTEMNHQPASPVLTRKNCQNRSSSADRRSESGGGILASWSARLTPTLSPRVSRKYYQDIAPRASRIRQWIASHTVADPAVCHDSLMDQIKRGTHLKPAGSVNDRSAPKTRYY